MPRVLCILDFASEEISGVRFERTDAGMLSAEISDEAAALFALIPGYKLVKDQAPTAGAEEAASSPAPEGSGEVAAHQTAKPKRRSAN